MKKKLSELILALDSVGLIFIGLFLGCLVFTLVVVELPMYVFKILGATIAIIFITSRNKKKRFI